jgi:hypothetical protein
MQVGPLCNIQFTFEALLISTKKVHVLESGVYLIRLDGPVSFKIDVNSYPENPYRYFYAP